jgi:hypothetical protein
LRVPWNISSAARVGVEQHVARVPVPSKLTSIWTRLGFAVVDRNELHRAEPLAALTTWMSASLSGRLLFAAL